MTEQDKQLLLKDICSRLPYGVKVRRYVYTSPNSLIESVELFNSDWLKELYMKEADFNPYLFPISSMSSKQKAELTHLSEESNSLFDQVLVEIDFYNKYHFDYRGLIEKSIAIDATNLNIY